MPGDGGGTITLEDRYVLGDVIGRGGMAEVYRAKDTVLDRNVAVKLLRDTTVDPSDRARFVAEAKTLAKLNHAGLVTVLDAGTANDHPYLVMELIDGPTLTEAMDGTPVPLTQVGAVGTQLADGLAHAHAAGVVHRDVKPGNIMLGKDGRVWLTDFGIARLLGDDAHHTQTGMTIGSPAYLAPEQVRGQEVSPATDVYSLGLVLLEMLTGRRAYPQPATEAALARLSTPPEIPADVPDGWRRLVERMTALEPDRRPTAAEVADQVSVLSNGEDPTAATAVMATDGDATRVMPPPASAPEAAAAAPAPPRTARTVDERSSGPGRGTTIAAVAALAVVLLIVLVFVLPGGGGADEIPEGVPPALEQPLGELHDAVHGGS